MNISLASDGGFSVRHVAQAEIRLGETRYGLPSSDDDLRDEVAKVVLVDCVAELGVCARAVEISFECADLWMTERARRREGR